MAKRLKLRLSRILSTCRSKHDPSALPSDPVPSFLRLPKLNHSLPTVDLLPSPFPTQTHSQTFHWKREKDFHVISTSRRRPPLSSDALFTPPRPSLARRMRRRRETARRKKHGRAAPFRHFPSIGLPAEYYLEAAKRRHRRAAETELGEEEDREEVTENLISSVPSSCDDDGSDPDADDMGSREKSNAAEVGTLMKRRVSEVEFEARLSAVEGRCGGGGQRKVRESYAVVKRTEDPYGEFRRSMMEMVTEKEMYEEEELEEMLRCLLSLNGREHHGIILRAFAEIWDALFLKEEGHRDGITGANSYQAN